jgi:hypothetical protein
MARLTRKDKLKNLLKFVQDAKREKTMPEYFSKSARTPARTSARTSARTAAQLVAEVHTKIMKVLDDIPGYLKGENLEHSKKKLNETDTILVRLTKYYSNIHIAKHDIKNLSENTQNSIKKYLRLYNNKSYYDKIEKIEDEINDKIFEDIDKLILELTYKDKGNLDDETFEKYENILRTGLDLIIKIIDPENLTETEDNLREKFNKAIKSKQNDLPDSSDQSPPRNTQESSEIELISSNNNSIQQPKRRKRTHDLSSIIQIQPDVVIDISNSSSQKSSELDIQNENSKSVETDYLIDTNQKINNLKDRIEELNKNVNTATMPKLKKALEAKLTKKRKELEKELEEYNEVTSKRQRRTGGKPKPKSKSNKPEQKPKPKSKSTKSDQKPKPKSKSTKPEQKPKQKSTKVKK